MLPQYLPGVAPFIAELFARVQALCFLLTPTDSELVALLQQGSEAAFRTLVDRYQRRVYSTIRAFVPAPADAEDLVQEVFLDVYQSVHQFRGKAALSTWLYRLATSRALKHVRKGQARKRFAFLTSLFGPDNEVLHHPVDPRHPAALLEGEQQLGQLQQAIARLPAQQQAAFMLRHRQDLTHQEIAEVLQTSVSAVESMLVRAKKTLRSTLNRADFYG